MPKKPNDKLAALLAAKSPTAMRTPIKPIDILNAAATSENPNVSEEMLDETGKQNEKSDGVIAHLQEIVKSDEQKPAELVIEKSEYHLSSTNTVKETDNVQASENQGVRIDEQVDGEKTSKNVKLERRSEKRSEKPVQKSTVKNRTRKPHVYSEQTIHAVLAVDKRATKRYSFEIYVDQDNDIKDVCDLYEAQTGVNLSASRLIREVLDTFLPDALKTLRAEEK